MLGFPQHLLRRRSPLEVLDDFFGGAGMNDLLFGDALFSFKIDANEEEGNIVIRADLPGVQKEDINVTLENGMLVISAKRESQTEKKSNTVYAQERTFGHFCRSFRVPADVNENVHATLKDGVLQLILERTKASKPRKIEIS